MADEATKCPNCGELAVSEYANLFGCSECGQWGYSRDKLIYSNEQNETWRQDGQVPKKPPVP